MNHAAGSPVAIVLKPRVRNAQAGPAARIRGSSAKLRTAPPKPPPAKTTPLAKPRFLLKYCADPVEVTWNYVSPITIVSTDYCAI